MVKGEYKPSFPLRLMHKDLGLLLDLGNQLEWRCQRRP